MVDAIAVELAAKETLGWSERCQWNSKDKDCCFRAVFGASSTVAASLWNKMTQQQPIELGGELKHLLWSLVFLKVHATTHIHCSIVGWPSTKTCAKWSWHFIKQIADLKEEVISLENRFDGLGQVANTNCFISVDGTDCPMFEP